MLYNIYYSGDSRFNEGLIYGLKDDYKLYCSPYLPESSFIIQDNLKKIKYLLSINNLYHSNPNVFKKIKIVVVK